MIDRTQGMVGRGGDCGKLNTCILSEIGGLGSAPWLWSGWSADPGLPEFWSVLNQPEIQIFT